MSKTRWTEELELKLLKRYRKFSCLWMTSLPGYKDLDKRYAAYVKIVESLRPEFPSLTVPKVVYKIRDLRYRYCLELTKIERAAGGATSYGHNFTTNFHLFQWMHSFPDLNFNRHPHHDYDHDYDHHHHPHHHEEQENEEYIESDDDEESKIEDNNTGTYLTPSTCETIYDNRLKMLEDSKSTFEEFEKPYNDDGDREEYGELWDITESWCNVDDELRSKEAEEIETGKLKGKARVDKSRKNSKVKLHTDIEKLEIKMTRTLLRSSLNDCEKKCVEVNEKNYSSNKDKKFDEFDAFAVSIGSQLAKIDPELIAKIQVMIFIILEEESSKNPRR